MKKFKLIFTILALGFLIGAFCIQLNAAPQLGTGGAVSKTSILEVSGIQYVPVTISSNITLTRPGLYRCDGSGPYVINANSLFSYIGSESIFTNLLSGESIFFTSGSIGSVGNAGATAYAVSDGTAIKIRVDSGVSLTASCETGAMATVPF